MGIVISSLQMKFSQQTVAILRAIFGHLGDGLYPLIVRKESDPVKEEVVENISSDKSKNLIFFEDDLRSGLLRFIAPSEDGQCMCEGCVCKLYNLYLNILCIDNSPYTLPEQGTILCYPGDGEIMPAITWTYTEPHCLIHIHTMPVPFDVSIATKDLDLSVS